MAFRVVTFGFGLALAVVPAAADEATIFAAASLIDVMQELAAGFAEDTDHSIIIVPGSSSTLSKQIIAGAPADGFFSANREFADLVAEHASAQVYDMFGNSLAIIAPAGFEGEVTLDQLPEALGEGRLAIGDPDHVPAGRYAKEALESAGLWEALAPRLAPAGDVRAALAFVSQGAAPFGIVYRTDAQVEGVRLVGEVDPALHTPVRYFAVWVNPENVVADQFFSYVGSMEGQNWLDYLGFDVGRDFDFLDEGPAGEASAEGDGTGDAETNG